MIQKLVEDGSISTQESNVTVSAKCRSVDSHYAHGLGKNEAFVLKEKGTFCYETRECPKLPSDKHVIVAVKATGLCGSDVHYWQHGEIGDFKVCEPIVLGHESAAVVQKCGPGVQSLRPGDVVALEPGIPCRTCAFCRGGKYNLCADVHFAATPPHDGTLATYYAVPEDFCFKLPSNIGVEEGALVEPLSVAIHCAKLGEIHFGTSVLVLGAGPIGLLCCAVARTFGATTVVAVDIVEERLLFAQRYAATNTYRMDQSGSATNAANIRSSGEVADGFDVVIDATGVESCIATGIHALKRGGTFVQAGLGAPNINLPVGQLCSKEANYRGSFRYGPGDYSDAIAMLQHNRISVKELITHRYEFTDAEEAFKNVAQRQGIKSIILGPGIPLHQA